jgi:tRNA (guanine37-N1)-methyltransferase
MRIDIVTVLPELLRSPFEASIMKRAIDKGLVEVHFHNLRDYTTNRQKVWMIILMVVVLGW